MNPLRFVRMPRWKGGAPRVLTEKRMRLLTSTACDLHERTIVEVLYGTGARPLDTKLDVSAWRSIKHTQPDLFVVRVDCCRNSDRSIYARAGSRKFRPSTKRIAKPRSPSSCGIRDVRFLSSAMIGRAKQFQSSYLYETFYTYPQGAKDLSSTHSW